MKNYISIYRHAIIKFYILICAETIREAYGNFS